MSLLLKLFRVDIRHYFSSFLLTIASVMFATMLLTGVFSLITIFETTITNDSRNILGGDLRVRLSGRDFSDEELDWFAEQNATLSHVRTLRTFALGENGSSHLANAKEIDGHYPLYGNLEMRDGQTLHAPPADGEALSIAYVEESLAEQLEVDVGKIIRFGGLSLTVAGIITREPDPDQRNFLISPAILVHAPILRDSIVNVPGIRVNRSLRIKLAEGVDADDFKALIEQQFPETQWRVTTIENTFSRLQEVLDEVGIFLTITVLVAILIAGMGIGLSTSIYLRKQQANIGILKIIGTQSGFLKKLYYSEILFVSVIGIVLGVLLGVFALLLLFPHIGDGKIFPLLHAGNFPYSALGRSGLLAMLICLIFIVIPIRECVRTPALRLISTGHGGFDSVKIPLAEYRYLLLPLLAAWLLVPSAFEQKYYLLILVAIFGVLACIGLLVLKICGAWQHKLRFNSRFALGLLLRHRRHFLISILSIGTSILALSTLHEVEHNLSANLEETLSNKTPKLFALGILNNQIDDFRHLLEEADPEYRVNHVPITRGRITRINGEDARSPKFSENRHDWILRNERGITWSDDGEIIGSSRLVKGVMWDESVDGLQVSFDAEAAESFGIDIGSTIEIALLGRTITATVTALRKIDWSSFDVNFVMILSRRPFEAMPFSYFATVFTPEEANIPALQRNIVGQFPSVTPINLKNIFKTLEEQLTKISLFVTIMQLFTLSIGLMVIAISFYEVQQRHLHDLSVLRLLGATQKQILAIARKEMTITVASAIVPMSILGSCFGGLIVLHQFNLEWQWEWTILASVIGFAFAFCFILVRLVVFPTILRADIIHFIRNE